MIRENTREKAHVQEMRLDAAGVNHRHRTLQNTDNSKYLGRATKTKLC